jgi:hypothetical protein
VIQDAEELVEAVGGWKMFIQVAEMVLAELTRGVTEGFEHFGERRVLLLQPDGRAGNADGAQTDAQRILPGDEGRPARRA